MAQFKIESIQASSLSFEKEVSDGDQVVSVFRCNRLKPVVVRATLKIPVHPGPPQHLRARFTQTSKQKIRIQVITKDGLSDLSDPFKVTSGNQAAVLPLVFCWTSPQPQGVIALPIVASVWEAGLDKPQPALAIPGEIILSFA